jgi:hypothetical protein
MIKMKLIKKENNNLIKCMNQFKILFIKKLNLLKIKFDILMLYFFIHSNNPVV